MNEKEIIQKLFKIASKQQKIIEKLAQGTDPNVAYLQRAADTALLNLSPTTPVSAKVSVLENKYVVAVKGLSANEQMKLAFKANLDKSVSSQQSSLVGTYDIHFE